MGEPVTNPFMVTVLFTISVNFKLRWGGRNRRGESATVRLLLTNCAVQHK